MERVANCEFVARMEARCAAIREAPSRISLTLHAGYKGTP
jgi:hypothetical protein